MMNDKIKTALGGSGGSVSVIEQKPVDDIPSPSEDSVEQEKRIPNIVTTEEELEAFFIIKNLFADLVDIHEITYRIPSLTSISCIRQHQKMDLPSSPDRQSKNLDCPGRKQKRT